MYQQRYHKRGQLLSRNSQYIIIGLAAIAAIYIAVTQLKASAQSPKVLTNQPATVTTSTGQQYPITITGPQPTPAQMQIIAGQVSGPAKVLTSGSTGVTIIGIPSTPEELALAKAYGVQITANGPVIT